MIKSITPPAPLRPAAQAAVEQGKLHGAVGHTALQADQMAIRQRQQAAREPSSAKSTVDVAVSGAARIKPTAGRGEGDAQQGGSSNQQQQQRQALLEQDARDAAPRRQTGTHAARGEVLARRSSQNIGRPYASTSPAKTPPPPPAPPTLGAARADDDLPGPGPKF